jgi:aquaporin Z
MVTAKPKPVTAVAMPKLVAEAVGTFFLVFFGAGVATLSFGFKLTGSSISAGVVTTALTFGLVLLVLAYALGPISGCHINPAVTMGFVVSRRMALGEAAGYWIAQVVGAIAGALVLWGVMSGSPLYSRRLTGLGANGVGKQSLIHINTAGAFGVELIMTLLFVFVVLAATSRLATPGFAGLAIGLALVVAHLIGIPITGTSVNPARSLGPALVVGHAALSQLWLFIIAPLVGGAIGAVLYRFFFAEEAPAVGTTPSIPTAPAPT